MSLHCFPEPGQRDGELSQRGWDELGKTTQDKTIPFLQNALIKRQGLARCFLHCCEKVKWQKHTERIRELNTLNNLVRGQMIQNI